MKEGSTDEEKEMIEATQQVFLSPADGYDALQGGAECTSLFWAQDCRDIFEHFKTYAQR